MYIVADLIDFGLVDHSQLIVSICDSATAEYALESHLKKLVKHWEQEEFKLMKYHKVKQPVQRSDKSTREANKVYPNLHKASSLYYQFILLLSNLVSNRDVSRAPCIVLLSPGISACKLL